MVQVDALNSKKCMLICVRGGLTTYGRMEKLALVKPIAEI